MGCLITVAALTASDAKFSDALEQRAVAPHGRRLLPAHAWQMPTAQTFGLTRIGSSVDNVISAVDINGAASNKPSRIMSQECRCGADVFDAHLAMRWRFGLRLFE